jgi:hypothetical protein
MLGDEELAAMKARVEAATAGPWCSCVEGRDQDGGDSFIMTGGEDIYIRSGSYRGGSEQLRADQDFIANARQDVPRLIAEVERLRKLIV